jgi:orotate phosphoribosyltransferase
MNSEYRKSQLDSRLEVTVFQGHFATRHSHNSRYIDMTRILHEHTMANHAARILAQRYSYDKLVDTVVCMDGSEVVGAFLARHLAKDDRFNINRDKNIDIITPEYDSNGQLIFRANLTPMVAGKPVLLLISTVNSGKTVQRALECVEYYGGTVQGIAAIFSTQEEVSGIPVYSLFTPQDIPGYLTSAPKNCPMCKEGKKIDALSNSYGFSPL